MSKLIQLQSIIDKTLQAPGSSKLSKEVIDSVGGFTSPNIRHLLNNLAAISESYCELGSHVGSTLISARYGNNHLKDTVGIDNFSLFSTEQHDSKAEFFKNCDANIPGQYRLLNQDAWTTTKKDFPIPIDLFLSDGAHDFESQKKAITHFAPFLAKEAIICLDDSQWTEPMQGTLAGIEESGLSLKWVFTFDSGVRSDCGDFGFWNGFTVFLVESK